MGIINPVRYSNKRLYYPSEKEILGGKFIEIESLYLSSGRKIKYTLTDESPITAIEFILLSLLLRFLVTKLFPIINYKRLHI